MPHQGQPCPRGQAPAWWPRGLPALGAWEPRTVMMPLPPPNTSLSSAHLILSTAQEGARGLMRRLGRRELWALAPGHTEQWWGRTEERPERGVALLCVVRC